MLGHTFQFITFPAAPVSHPITDPSPSVCRVRYSCFSHTVAVTSFFTRSYCYLHTTTVHILLPKLTRGYQFAVPSLLISQGLGLLSRPPCARSHVLRSVFNIRLGKLIPCNSVLSYTLLALIFERLISEYPLIRDSLASVQFTEHSFIAADISLIPFPPLHFTISVSTTPTLYALSPQPYRSYPPVLRDMNAGRQLADLDLRLWAFTPFILQWSAFALCTFTANLHSIYLSGYVRSTTTHPLLLIVLSLILVYLFLNST